MHTEAVRKLSNEEYMQVTHRNLRAGVEAAPVAAADLSTAEGDGAGAGGGGGCTAIIHTNATNIGSSIKSGSQ